MGFKVEDFIKPEALGWFVRFAKGEGMRTYLYCQPPAGGSLRSSTFKLIRRLRRRNHEWAEGWFH
jgi:hypothetical protein